MIAIVSDTHGRDDARLTGRTRSAIERASLVVHAGDFITEPVVDAFAKRAKRFVGVHGNVDTDAVRERLPHTRTVHQGNATIAVVHTVNGGDTELGLLGRDRDADLVVHGHSHRPRYVWTGAVGLLNPGSHAQPRGNRPGHAELVVRETRIEGELVEPDGTTIQRFSLPLGAG